MSHPPRPTLRPPGGLVRVVGDDDFADVVLGATTPVLVVFHSACDWLSGSSEVLVPALDELALDLPHLAFARLDVDRWPVTPSAYRVAHTPALLIFDRGTPVLTLTGVHTAPALRRLLDALQGHGQNPWRIRSVSSQAT